MKGKLKLSFSKNIWPTNVSNTFLYKYLQQTPATSHGQWCKWAHTVPIYGPSPPPTCSLSELSFCFAESQLLLERSRDNICALINERIPGHSARRVQTNTRGNDLEIRMLREFKQDQHFQCSPVSWRVLRAASRLQVAQAPLSGVLAWACKYWIFQKNHFSCSDPQAEGLAENNRGRAVGLWSCCGRGGVSRSGVPRGSGIAAQRELTQAPVHGGVAVT